MECSSLPPIYHLMGVEEMKSKKNRNTSRLVPSYTLHKPTGQGRVRINGKDYYTGPFNSAESLKRYDELIGEFLRDRSVDGYLMTIDELALKFLAWTEARYRKHGEPSEHHRQYHQTMKDFRKSFGRVRCIDFGPRKLKEYREQLRSHGLCRKTINSKIGRIVFAFGWAVSEEFLPETVHRALACVPQLRVGEARDNPKVKPVSIEEVEATETFMSLAVRGLVRFQLYTGARPGEARIVRPCDIDRSGPVWKFIPQRHKTEHHGKERAVFIGPRCQQLLTAYEPAAPESADPPS
ncbi:MAG: tyrosine-type recombinase/integrase, partial [Planctomycetaceae bacterium]